MVYYKMNTHLYITKKKKSNWDCFIWFPFYFLSKISFQGFAQNQRHFILHQIKIWISSSLCVFGGYLRSIFADS